MLQRKNKEEEWNCCLFSFEARPHDYHKRHTPMPVFLFAPHSTYLVMDIASIQPKIYSL